MKQVMFKIISFHKLHISYTLYKINICSAYIYVRMHLVKKEMFDLHQLIRVACIVQVLTYMDLLIITCVHNGSSCSNKNAACQHHFA